MQGVTEAMAFAPSRAAPPACPGWSDIWILVLSIARHEPLTGSVKRHSLSLDWSWFMGYAGNHYVRMTSCIGAEGSLRKAIRFRREHDSPSITTQALPLSRSARWNPISLGYRLTT